MKFLDPMATFQYMGGALPIHVVLTITCYMTLKDDISCILNYPKYNVDDQKFMLKAHVLIIFNIMLRRSLHICTKKRYNFIKQNLNLISTFIYMLSITFTWFKMFNWSVDPIILEQECLTNHCCAFDEEQYCNITVSDDFTANLAICNQIREDQAYY